MIVDSERGGDPSKRTRVVKEDTKYRTNRFSNLNCVRGVCVSGCLGVSMSVFWTHKNVLMVKT